MKKRMERLTVFLCVLLLLTGGCGKDEKMAAVVTTQEENVQTEEEPEVEEAQEEQVPLSIETKTNHKTYYLEDGETPYLYLQYCDITVEGNGYEDLKRNLENWSLERSEDLRNQNSSFLELVDDETDSETFYGYSLGQTITTARIDEQIVSLLDTTYQYAGGTHQSNYYEGVNFDTKTGKELSLEDVIVNMESFQSKAAEHIISCLKENYAEGLYMDYASSVEAIWEDAKQPAWYFDANGLVIILQEYEVGPYAMGAPEIHFSYADYKQYIKDAYLPDHSEGVARMAENEELFLSFSEAVEVPVMLKCDWMEYHTEASLWVGNYETKIGEVVSLDDSYIVKHQGNFYCMIEVDMASEDYVTYIYRLTETKAEEVAQIDASIDTGNINVNEIVMESWVYLLGTYGGVKSYRFDENGNYATSDTEYTFENNTYVLTTTTDLPVTIGESDSTLPAGSHIVLNATDDESYVTFTISETGQTGVLKVQRGEDFYNVTIAGMSENDCFEELPYAG